MSASSDIFMCTSNSSSRTVFLVQSQFYQRSHKPSTKVLMTQRVSNFTKETWMPKRSNVCFRGVWNMCLVVRLTLNRRCRISVRNENGDIQVFQKFDCAYFTALSEQSFWNSQKVFADFYRVPALSKQIRRSGSLLSEVSASVESVANRFTSVPFLILSQNLLLQNSWENIAFNILTHVSKKQICCKQQQDIKKQNICKTNYIKAKRLTIGVWARFFHSTIFSAVFHGRVIILWATTVML